MASLRHRRGIGAAKSYDDYIHDDDDGSGTTAPDTDDTATDPEEEEDADDDEEEEEEEREEVEDGRRRLHLGLHSMTAKVSPVLLVADCLHATTPILESIQS